MLRHTRLIGFFVFTAMDLYHVVADVCDLSVYAEPCGARGISQKACYAQHCCFQPASVGSQSKCYWPYSAEISAYHAVAVSDGYIGPLGSGFGNKTFSFQETSCQWLEELQPENRNDGWGIGWPNLHQIEAMEMATADELQGLDLVIYGDSISENWRGTSFGLPYTRHENGTEVTDTIDFVAPDMRATFFQTLGYQYKTAIMAIAGDHIGHLWWRLLNGHLPKKAPKVAIVLIGTNDLFAALQCVAQDEAQLKSTVKTIVSRFQQLLGVMRQGMPGTHIIVQGLYPRGADMQANKFVWPNNFTYARNLLNADYQELTMDDNLTHYISCGEDFILPTSDAIAQEYLPDGLHPNAKGLEIIADCLTPLLEKLYAMNETQQSTKDLQNILKVPTTGKAVTGAHHTNLTLPTYKKFSSVRNAVQPAKLIP